jgi:uncharacterized protein (TIGR03067 family)
MNFPATHFTHGELKMKSLLWACLFVAACMATVAIAEEEKPKADQEDIKLIEGFWKIEQVVVNGIEIGLDEVKNFRVVNGADGSWSLQLAGEEVAKGTSSFDQTKTPKEFDFMSTDGDGKENRFVGIYELDENTRKICYTNDGSARPTEFASTPENQCVLATFARVKQE